MLYLCSVIQKRKESKMNWNEVEKYARKKGWEFERHGTKHDIYRHPNKPYKIQIERHWSTEVKDGLLKTLLKRIGE